MLRGGEEINDKKENVDIIKNQFKRPDKQMNFKDIRVYWVATRPKLLDYASYTMIPNSTLYIKHFQRFRDDIDDIDKL